VAPGQVQRPEIDLGFVVLGAVQGTTAVPAKPPGVRIGAGATWGSQFDRIHPCRLDKPPRGDDE
jgi:hypothetical protein